MKILIVDDMEENLYLLETLLKGSGYEVVSAKDGLEALTKLKEESVDLIISDILMPQMDGFQFCRECKKNDRFKKLPFMFYTATYGDKKDEEFAMSLGADKFILKPQEPEALLKLLSEVIEKHKKGILTVPKEPIKEEEETYFVKYNERLIKKLEKKTLDLEKSEIHIKYLYSVLKAIRNVNQLIVIEKNRAILTQKTCDILTGVRGYNTAWLALLKDEKSFTTVVGSSREEFIPFCAQVLKGDHPPCIKKTFTTKDPFLFMDRSRDCGGCSLKKLHLGKNSLLIRITHESKLFGFLVLSLESDVYMDQEEKELLQEVADDIAFTLYSIESEEERKQAEEKYRSLFESSKDGIAFTNMEGNLLNANQAFLDMLGYKMDELRRLTYQKLLPKKWQNDIIRNQLRTRGYSDERELELTKKDGIIFPISIKVWMSNNEQGKPAGMWAMIRDISERKKAEEELGKLTKFPTENPNPVLRISKDGIVLFHNYASEPLLKHWHYKEEKPLQDRWFQFVLDALRDNDIKTAEIEIDDKVISLTFAPIIDKGFVNVYGLDITERKQAEEEERKQQKNIELLSEAAIQLVELPQNKDIYDFIGEKLKEFTGKNTIIIVNSIDTEKDILVTRTVLGLGKLSGTVADLLGKYPVGTIYNAKDENLSYLSDGKLHLYKEGVYGILLKTVPRTICNSMEKLFNVKKIYTIGFTKENRLFGTAIIFFKENAGEFKNKQTVETFIKQASIAIQRKHAEERLKNTLDAAIQTISKIVEVKDPYTAGHQLRVSQLTTAIAKELNLSPDKVEGIRVSSLIHDIGKLSAPTEILSKTTKLSDIEFNLIKVHSQIGYDILRTIDFSYPVAQIVLQHHERLDGSGYPNNLKGDEIRLEAKIIGVADVVEAISSHRPYRPAKGIDAALEEISQNRGILYDPEVVDACLKLFKEKEFKFDESASN